MKKVIALVLALIMILALAACGEKESDNENFEFEHEVSIIVPAGAGGGSDSMARALALSIEKVIGQPVNVENLKGGNEAIGRAEIIARDADGYTIMVTTSTHITEQALGNMDTPEALMGLSLLHQDVYGIHVLKGGKFATVEDLITYAKANPGKVTIGGTYSKSLDEIAVRQFEKAAGIEVTYVPYDSAGNMQADVLGGHTDAIIDEFSAVKDLIAADKLTALVALTTDRLADYATVPTTVEKGWNVTDGMLRGLLIRTDTPAEIVKVWEDVIKQAYESEEYKTFAHERMLDLANVFTGSEGYSNVLKTKVSEYVEVFKQIGAL